MAVDMIITTNEEETTAMPLPTRNVVIWYHIADQELAYGLDKHLQLLALRYPMFVLHYFRYPESQPLPESTENMYLKGRYEDQQKEYERKFQNMLNILERHTALFLPYVSTEFMTRFWKDTQSTTRLQAIFTEPSFSIMPLSMQAVAGFMTMPLTQPLAAYATGNEREVAYAMIASAIESQLLALLPQEYKRKAALPAPIAIFNFRGKENEQKEEPTITPRKRFWWFNF